MTSSSSGSKRTRKPVAAQSRAKKAGAAAAPATAGGRFSLEAVYAAARRQVPVARQAELQEFLAEFYRRLEEDEYPQHPPQAWAAIGLDMLEFARRRSPGTASVRVFNPSLKDNGWESAYTVLQIVNDDMPFLVDSVSMALAEMGVGVHVLGHPLVRIARDASGRLQSVGEGRPESLMLLEIDRQAPSAMHGIEQRVAEVLAEVRGVIADWGLMRERMQVLADDLATRRMPVDDTGRREAQEFLRWAANDHFILFGYREYKVVKQGGEAVLAPVDGTGLGLMRGKDRSPPRPVRTLAAHGLNRSGSSEALILTKTNARSRIHRKGYMDYIGVLEFDAGGTITGEQRFLGLYTSSAYNRRPWEIPLVRERYEHVMRRSGLSPSSHSGKALRHILETLPREELFQSSEEELYRTATGVLGLQERVRSRLFLRRDRYGRFFSALVYIPRERFNTDVRLRIEALLKEALGGEQVDSSVVLGESPLAQLHLIVRPRGGAAAELDTGELERRLARLLRNWRDDLRELLIARHGEAEGLRLANGYGRALPAGYIEDISPELAANDVEQLAALAGPEDLRLSLHTIAREGGSHLRLKLYRQHDDIPLSDVLPLMENMGLKVISEHPYRLQASLPNGGSQPIYIQDFEVERAIGGGDVAALAPVFEQAFAAIWSGQAENDGLNRLVLAAGLEWRQVALLRGYWKYLLQTGVPFSQNYVEETLGRYPLLARLLVELFEARFHPATGRESRAQVLAGQQRLVEQLRGLAAGDEAVIKSLQEVVDARGGDRDAQVRATHGALLKLLDRVSSLDDDRILRGFIGAIEATLRTSYFQAGADGRPGHCISFKFDSAQVPDLPRPRPYREIFVYGPRVEGVHLRFGPVARGGLRWSDRREDFRTEVLGLVKAQMVKNTVIVPVGAKGGFFVKQPPASGERDAVLAEGIACYTLFIQGLLDITDNIVGGKIVPPRDVVRHDQDDPYLVVAADKGTATFSDIANGLATAHGFWLGDAFASGGSVGYDHKGMGITARGAWESVKRHFRALGRDCQSEDFTCVGIGDMSGDVFGNGMLLSKHIRLVAAFDHRHIFLDPDPDAARSFAERERLFGLPRSSWADYDATLIGKGGGIHPRSAKSIEITPQVRAVLGLEDGVKSLSPNELMSAILQAPVDLLWNGGIGTYVKASSEQNADVGDRANNALRVNGGQLRCRVVGEGGNLGLTQLGRIEAAQQAGVLLNTDFIDNSAGVDTSDHEVNIKILLDDVVRAKRLTVAARNRLLASMTDEVARLVLLDNTRQNQAISLMERMSVKRLGSKQHFIRTLEKQGLLDRQIEFLPSDAELSARKARGQGMTRPELAVLLSYSKLVAFQQLLDSDIPEDPYLSKELQRYFPVPLQKKYADAMERHRLKREIIATAVTNATINRMGATFLLRMQEDTGRSPAEVAKAYTISRETLDARMLWAQIDTLDGKLPEAAQIDALQVIWSLQRSFVRWLLNRPGPMPSITEAVERYRDPFNDIREASGVLPDSQRPVYEAALREWRDKGMPPKLAQQLSELPYLEPAFDIIELARARKLKPVDVSRVHFRLGDALGLPWLFEQIDALAVDGRWHAVARGVMRDELAAHHRVLAGQAMSQPGNDADAKVRHWLQRDDPTLRLTLGMLSDLSAQKTLDYPTLSVAVQKLGQLAARG